MKHLLTIVGAVLISALPSAAAEAGKHLFILSGQSNMAGLNPAVSFTPTVAAEFGKDNVIVVKNAQGGQPIRRWYKKWNALAAERPAASKPAASKPATASKPAAPGDLYDKLMADVKAAVKGQKIATVTFVWMQGEADSHSNGPIYAAALKGLIAQLEADLGRKDVNFVIGRLSDHGMASARFPQWALIRQAQVEVAEGSPRGAWVDTDDLNDGKTRAGKEVKNDLHYSAQGYKILGKRFAETAIALIKKAAPSATT